MEKNPSQIQISAIVPVYNEEKTVANVIKVLLQNKSIDEVIVVNDGSSDNTPEILKTFAKKIVLINFKKNQGKGMALTKGIAKAKGKIVAFFDADTINLSNKYIKKILQPMSNPQVRGVIGFRTRSQYVPVIFAPLSGERAYYRQDLIPHLKKISTTRFGVEVFLNNLYKDKLVKKVPLRKFKQLWKHEKHSPATAAREFLDEGIEIAKQLVKQEKIIPKDLKIINQLKTATTLNEIKQKIYQISNKKIKMYFEKYILKDLQKAYDFWEKQI